MNDKDFESVVMNIVKKFPEEQQVDMAKDFREHSLTYLELQNCKKDLKQEKASQPPTTQEIPQIQKRKFWHNFSAVNVKTGAKMFFLPLRLFAYGFLVVGILILIKHQSFDTIAFFSGLVVANILIIAGIILKNHSI